MNRATRQIARLSTDPCRAIEAALISAGYLAGTLSRLELPYPVGGCWHVPTDTQQLVIAVTARLEGASEWTLRIEPGKPLRPTVVYRKPPSEARMRAIARVCFDVALTLHAALQPLCPELRWQLETDNGDVTYVAAPVPPSA